VTRQTRFDLFARVPVFSTPRYRPVRTDFDFDVHSPPVPFELHPPRTVGTSTGPAMPRTTYAVRNSIVCLKAVSETGSAPYEFQPLGSC